MSQSANTHLIRKRGSNVLYPYSDDLAAKAGFVTLTMQEALDQGLLDKRRHTKGPDPQTSELVGVIEGLKAENAILHEKLETYMANGVTAMAQPAAVPEVAGEIQADAEQDEESTSVVEEANELSELLAEIDNGPAASAG